MLPEQRNAGIETGRPGVSAILAPAMPWTIPTHPEVWHPNRKFAFGREVLFHLHVQLGLSPKAISELHEKVFGFTIWPQGVRSYLKAYGFYRPPEKERGRYCYQPDRQGLKSFVEVCEKVLLDSKKQRN